MSEIALRLIAENERSRFPSLDLGDCQLTELPSQLGELKWLRSLNLASLEWKWDGHSWQSKQGAPNRELRDIRVLAALSSLQSLNISFTPVSDLAPLAALSSLQFLSVSSTKVADLAPLAPLASLQFLDAPSTQVSDLAPLAALSSLQFLNVSFTQLVDLAPLAALSSLQSLDVSRTQVADLAPLAALSSLQSLDVSRTQVADLTPLVPWIARGRRVRWSRAAWEGSGIYIEECPLTTPPLEIVRQGNRSILNYFVERDREGVDYLHEAKMLVLGEPGTGKTSLLQRLYLPQLPLPNGSEPSKGISIHRHEFVLRNGRTFRINAWDFGGQEIYHATYQFFLTGRSLYVLLDDTQNDNRSVSDEGFRYWLDLIDVFGGHSPIIIFQNEKFGRSKAIDIAGIRRHYDNVVALYSGDLQRQDATHRLSGAIESLASNLSHIGDQVPARWIRIREDIEAEASNTPYISLQDYFTIYGRHIEFDRAKSLHLSRYFHDLGVFLHFQDDPVLAHTFILQNEWVTEAVFRILGDETIEKNFGQFRQQDCERLWSGSVYAEMHAELLALMKRFELCYELRDVAPATWLAPQLLPPAKPAALIDWAVPEDLVLRYRYDFLPKGMISRLMVRLHRFVGRPDMAWVTGVLFARESTETKVEILPNGAEIELRARGPEQSSLLHIIASDLDALNNGYEGLRDKVHKLVHRTDSSLY